MNEYIPINFPTGCRFNLALLIDQHKKSSNKDRAKEITIEACPKICSSPSQV
jgi:hypothetical protein